MIDIYKQEWCSLLERSSVLYDYRQFKVNFTYENYLDILPRKYRFYFCRLRLSVHPLKIQTGRHDNNNIPREQRYCQCCNLLDLEDECHFVCVCPGFIDIRKKYIKRYYYIRPSMFKFNELLNSQSKNILISLSKYIEESLSSRNAILNSL
mgnify:CR=1 FL=1